MAHNFEGVTKPSPERCMRGYGTSGTLNVNAADIASDVVCINCQRTKLRLKNKNRHFFHPPSGKEISSGVLLRSLFSRFCLRENLGNNITKTNFGGSFRDDDEIYCLSIHN